MKRKREQTLSLSVSHARGRGAYTKRRAGMNGLIYLVGLIVVIMAILSFLGLR